MKVTYQQIASFILIIVVLLVTGCSPAEQQFFTKVGSITLPTLPTPTPSASTSPVPTVCEPFGNDGSNVTTAQGHGLIAQLKYLSPDMPRYTNVEDYQTYGLPVNANFYFYDVNTPTRQFSSGFLDQGGTPLTSPDGTVLYEYFSLHYESQFKLPAGSPSKMYQFALLSDDGAVIQIQPNGTGGYQTLINDDEVHPTTMACATYPVLLSSTQGLPFKLDYFQGPRYEIALVLMFREWKADTLTGAAFDPNDPLCGASGNEEFFNDTVNPSVPQPNYISLLSRGWKVVPAADFYLPGNPSPPNPCDAVSTTPAH